MVKEHLAQSVKKTFIIIITVYRPFSMLHCIINRRLIVIVRRSLEHILAHSVKMVDDREKVFGVTCQATRLDFR